MRIRYFISVLPLLGFLVRDVETGPLGFYIFVVRYFFFPSDRRTTS